MSNNKILNLNRATGLIDDECHQSIYDIGNKSQFDYYIFSPNKVSVNANMLNERGVLSDNTGVVGKKAIQLESEFRNGKDGLAVTSEKSRKSKILPTRPVLSVPYMGYGKTAMVDPKKQADRLVGLDTRNNYKCLQKCDKRKWCDGTKCKKINGRCECNTIRNTACMCNTDRGVAIDRFEPLVPHVKQNVQNTQHIIESWVRGGVDTREIVRNSDYLKQIGRLE
jgi:hypothetical protein